MKIYDISLPIKTDMLLWPGDPGVVIETTATIAKDGVGESRFSFGGHTGTHIDAPSHFVANGKNIDELDLKKLIGSCMVVDLTQLDHLEIVPEDLSGIAIKKGSRILFKTGNFKYLHGNLFPDTYISLSVEGSQYLIEKGVVLVGTDFLGIEKRKAQGHPVHKTLLQAEIVNVEGLDLANVPAGEYELICLPINVAGADGAPARAVLIQQ